MIVNRTIRIVVAGRLVDSFDYKTPMTEQEREDLRFFLQLLLLAHPSAVIECVNDKNGVGETFKLVPDESDKNLFSLKEG